MDFAALSSRNGAFYAPAFEVRVAKDSLMRQLQVAVSQVEVDLPMGAAGRFSFTVVNAYDAEHRTFVSGRGKEVLDLLKFGSEVEVSMGYGAHSSLEPLIAGVITEITTSFSEGGAPELVVAGYDMLFPMTLGKGSDSWKEKSDSDVVGLLAAKYGLAADIESTKEQHAQIEQHQQSDFDFIKKLSDRNHFEFYVSPRKRLRFGRPRDQGGGVVTLRWGQSLLSFKPEANLATQVSAVEVYGWDSNQKKAIVGRAVAGEESGKESRSRSGGEQLRAALRRGPVLQLRQPVFTQAEAKQRAQAILNDHAKKFLTGEGECLGLPDLLPDRNVTLENLGEPFSKIYYIQQATHKFDGGGYRTRIKVKETSS